MKICFIAHANSIHARRWVEYFCKPGNEVFILSTTRNPRPLEGAVVYDLFTGKPVVPQAENITVISKWSLRSLLKRVLSTRVGSSLILNKFTSGIILLYRTFRLAGKASAIVKKLQPDLLHCLRFPIEGYIGGLIGYRPLVISSWGSDFVFFANKYFLLRWLTKNAIRRVDAYIPDTTRDKHIAVLYGFSPGKPTLVLPVTGGLKLDEFPPYRMPRDNVHRKKIGVDPDTNLLIMTRRFKSPYANTQALIEAMPQITKVFHNTLCVLVGDIPSPGYSQLRSLAEKLGTGEYVRFINWLGYSDFVNYLAASDIMVSVGLYDGCPVSMLEGMVCGVIPVMSNDFPIQEWITDNWNGYLFDPRDPESIAQAIVRALKNKDSFETMRKRNWDILAERADYYRNMKIAEELYHKLVQATPAGKSNRT